MNGLRKFFLAICIMLTIVTVAESKDVIADVFCPTSNEEARQAYNEGINLASQGDAEGAIAMYKKAIGLDPGYCDAMDNLGLIYKKTGNFEDAVKWYKKSIEVFPNNVVAHTNLANAYSVMGQITDSLTEYENVIQINPDYAEGYYGLGSIYFSLQKYEDCIEYMKKAEEIYLGESSPLVTDAQYYLGLSYAFLGKVDETKHYIGLVYPHMQDDPSVNYALGLVYLMQDTPDLDNARKYIKRAQELGVAVPQDVLDELGAE